MKKYKIKKTKKLMKTLSKYWKTMKDAEELFYQVVSDIEKRMEKETGIKGISFFTTGDGICGIGNYGVWSIPLIHGEELEEK